ncbi:MAG: AAA-like domain-containing protein [Deltaproteobacteria bacterium]|jgi:hypothetical protein|nr:AAA-like domain-containing protein [Deltaproteobacteria bacterium]
MRRTSDRAAIPTSKTSLVGAPTTAPSVKIFNTTGLCPPSKHYMLPALPRLPEAEDLIEGGRYFVIHAPRRSGKTTFLNALSQKINSEGRRHSLYCSIGSFGDIENEESAVTKILGQIKVALYASGVDVLKDKRDKYDNSPDLNIAGDKIRIFLNMLREDLDKDLVVFIDEADGLSGPGLVTFLSQIREGYMVRHLPGNKFPRSLVLVGVRDIRDYLARVRPDAESLGSASPFDIKKKALTLADFTREEINSLYGQHTEASGQVFEEGAVDRAWRWSQGQPWLVNALADEVVEAILKKDYSTAVTGALVDEAARNLIIRRDTHIDSLLARLDEPRVGRVMEPVIAGNSRWGKEVKEDDIKYVEDLGLIKHAGGAWIPANPVYASAITSALTWRIELFIPKYPDDKWIDGRNILMTSFLKEFQGFWRRNADKIDKPDGYAEAFPRLVLSAFTRRLLVRGVRLRDQDFGLGRVDILAEYQGRLYPVEIKTRPADGAPSQIIKDGVRRLRSFMEERGSSDEGWLIVFDMDPNKSWNKKIKWKSIPYKKATIHVVGC